MAEPGDGPMTTEDSLLQAVLGLLDNVTDRHVEAVRTHTISTYSTRFPTSAVYELFDTVERLRPGLLEHYAAVHTDLTKKARPAQASD